MLLSGFGDKPTITGQLAQNAFFGSAAGVQKADEISDSDRANCGINLIPDRASDACQPFRFQKGEFTPLLAAHAN
ncbi:hypothetical protein GGI1_03988 [Acidithiobacillus sp. GGI-221]|nr:hypothetical protein GGI1_03988 [Acidithiobacillus sp. GGI-221]